MTSSAEGFDVLPLIRMCCLRGHVPSAFSGSPAPFFRSFTSKTFGHCQDQIFRTISSHCGQKTIILRSHRLPARH